jgi:hypothetical protein
VTWLDSDKPLDKLSYELERKKDVVFCRFSVRFIPFAEIDGAIEEFFAGLENHGKFRYGAVELNNRYKYIPFARISSGMFYMFVYDSENPGTEPAIAAYGVKEVMMHICAVRFEDLMLQHFAWELSSARKSKRVVEPAVVRAYAMFLTGERAEAVRACEGGDSEGYSKLLKIYDDFLLTDDGVILDRQKFFPHLIAVNEGYEERENSDLDTVADESAQALAAQQFDRLIITGKLRKVIVEYDDIRYIEADNKTSCIRLKKRSVHCSKSLSFIESQLPPYCFFRCHKSFIVGFKHILTHSDHSVIFDNGEMATISKRRYSEFKEQYAEYLSKN